MEADFNMVSKIMIGDRMIKQAEKHGELPADTIGGRKDMASHEGGLNRILMSDVSRQRRQDLLMLSEDADTCYDRMQHTGISLSTRRLGVPTPTNTTMLVTLQQMRFFLRTGFGTSSTYFGRQQLTPFQGGCQGNGAAPGFWLAISIVLIRYMKQRGHITTFETAISQELLTIVAFMFVDDTDIPTLAKQGESTQALLTRSQVKATHWQQGLQFTGGDAKPSKSYCYIQAYKFEAGKWLYKSKEDEPGTITIQGPEGPKDIQ